MNIYKLEKLATPKPWCESGISCTEDERRGLVTLRQETTRHDGDEMDIVLARFESVGDMDARALPAKCNAILSAHCRNNFIRAIDALKRMLHFAECNGMRDCHDEPREFCEVCQTRKLIAELEEVKA